MQRCDMTEMHLYRVAIGAERCLSDSKTGVNMWLTKEEVDVLKSVNARLVRATHDDYATVLPQIHLQALGKTGVTLDG